MLKQSIIREVGLALCNIQWTEIIERKRSSDVEISHSKKKGGDSLMSKVILKRRRKSGKLFLAIQPLPICVHLNGLLTIKHQCREKCQTIAPSISTTGRVLAVGPWCLFVSWVGQLPQGKLRKCSAHQVTRQNSWVNYPKSPKDQISLNCDGSS